MFDWYWYFLFYLVMFHLNAVTFSLYVHRTMGHGLFTISKPLEHVFRFILWTGGGLGPNWAETYASRHRKHHKTSDTPDDPHSPFYMSLRQMCQGWEVDWDDVKKYCSDVKTPNDWLQKNFYEKYRNYGPRFIFLVVLILFGPIGFMLSVIVRESTRRWMGVFWGNYATHKFGFTYAGNRSPSDKSKIMFPWGILIGGEELHANHHNYPRSPSFRQKWFEIDIGYVYAVILSKLKLLKINNINQGN